MKRSEAIEIIVDAMVFAGALRSTAEVDAVALLNRLENEGMLPPVNPKYDWLDVAMFAENYEWEAE
jgi:hypothetical protein